MISKKPPDGSKAEISEPSGRKFFLNKFFKEYEIFTVQNFIKFLSKGDNTESDADEPTVVEVVVDDNPYIAKIVLKNPNLWRKMGRIWSFHKFLGFATLPSSVSFHLDVKSFVLLRLSIFMVDLIVVHADIGETLTLPIYYTRHDGQFNNPTYEVHSNHNLNFTTKISLTVPRESPSFSILNLNTFEAWSDVSRFINGERRELVYRNKRRPELFYLLIPVGFRLILNLKHDLRIFIGLNSNLYFELSIGKFTYDGAVFFPICLDSAKKKGFDFSNIHQWRGDAAHPFNAYLVYGDMLLEGSSFGLNGNWNYFIPPIVDFLANPDSLTWIGSIFGWNIPHDETLEQHYTMDKILQMMNRCYLNGDADSTIVLRDNAYREQTLIPETV
ncbi:hypothetical protein THOM_2636 [Trachipleistophora hominis]|uniref:Uncharacterized protein n=1 Tax=Trachipleistophora hominis TaxID=72359 RepID=L7JUL3_TRAHO|nr:hypothetical protein THOM_2636 [Trachipleistophora hominis]